MATTLLFGVHLHQPVDNFDFAVDKAVNKCYKPFFETVLKYDAFRFSVHVSGWLFERIKDKYKDLFGIIKLLSDSGRIEIFSGGFYEPVLASIPEKDRIGQIKLLNEFIKKQLNYKPKGLWLAERVWDGAIIPSLKQCGIEYVMVDDNHFINSGLSQLNLNGYYLSEYNTQTIALFPINRKLRYTLPFSKPDVAIDTIKSFETAIVFDDLEKFGLWPTTYQWVYKDKWLERFLEALLKSDVKTALYSEFYEKNKPLGLVYPNNVSYEEMGLWSMLYDDSKKAQDIIKNDPQISHLIKNGNWKNFFNKYPQSNRIHKRMLEMSKKQIKNRVFKENLYKSQTNDVLWHGIFGGIYLPNLRDNAYRYIISCDSMLEEKKITVEDIFLEGYRQAKFKTGKIIAIFDSKYSGQLVEFDSIEDKFNFQNTMTRKREVYHQINSGNNDSEAVKSIHEINTNVNETLKNALIYDWYEKNSFVDHISDESFDQHSFYRCNFKEYSDFANQPFEITLNNDGVIFKRDGGIYDEKKYNTTLKKVFKPIKNGIEFSIFINSETKKTFAYIVEFNFHFAEDFLINSKKAEDTGTLKTTSLRIFDKFSKKTVSINFDKPMQIYYFLLKTLSKSEKGFDLTTQGISLAFKETFNQSLSISGELKIENV
ncbi:alpha-amylase/4-alpha-glucanotransferase domain-containing protein [Hippea jasoniae]|uniref:alpha-amylase/4-alpha-glucanotransferase domain-containing protein n=1 Tax=Hippea jasoniae TaxID=944479 RepID=UPI00054D5EF0|nr:alpha-amylase/4-alpha-glucanotransferase domain-containing protein [Hippea jasoniae]